MKVDYELLQRGCDRALEIGLMKERIREASPERKAQHKLRRSSRRPHDEFREMEAEP